MLEIPLGSSSANGKNFVVDKSNLSLTGWRLNLLSLKQSGVCFSQHKLRSSRSRAASEVKSSAFSMFSQILGPVIDHDNRCESWYHTLKDLA